MNPIKSIRSRLSLTQAELANALEMSQGNVAFYERGQTVPPHVARRLILFARGRGCDVGYEDIYGPLVPGGVADAHDGASTQEPAHQAQAAINSETEQGAAHA